MKHREPLLLLLINFFLKPFTNNFFQQIRANKNVQNTISLYKSPIFTKIRFWDAPFIEVEKLVVKKGQILDLGCGEGVFSSYLAICSPQRKILGIEIDKKRIDEAPKSLPNLRFQYGNAITEKLPKSDNIILFHLLHHLKSFSDQERVIKRSLNSLNKNGKLIIVEVNPKFSIKYLAAWFTDHFLVPWLFEKRFYSPIFFRTSKEWIRIIKESGYKCRVIKAEKNKPFTHVLITCSK